MFCPQCRAEYCEGFYRCADCDVPLVNSLPRLPHEQADSSVGESLAVLWRGQNPVVLTAIVNALTETQIPFYDYPIQDPYAYLLSPFPAVVSLAPTLGPAIEIRVSRMNLQAAQQCVTAVLEQLTASQSTGTAPDVFPQPAGATGIEVSEDWNPEEATVQVWSGADAAMAQFIEATFRENGIPCRSLEGDGSRLPILVRPEDHARAHQILREIIEATPD